MDLIDFEKVTLREAKFLLAERNGNVNNSSIDSWEEKRRPPGLRDVKLHDDAFKWIASLPEKFQPRQLGRFYPRIVNRLALVWGKRTECERELDNLLMDNRGNRRGLPMDLAAEIMALKMYYSSSSDQKQENMHDWSKSVEGRVR